MCEWTLGMNKGLRIRLRTRILRWRTLSHRCPGTHRAGREPATPAHIQAAVSPVLLASALQPLRWPGTWNPGISQGLSLENPGTCGIVSVACFLHTASIPKGLLQPKLKFNVYEEYRSSASVSSHRPLDGDIRHAMDGPPTVSTTLNLLRSVSSEVPDNVCPTSLRTFFFLSEKHTMQLLL